MTRKKILLPLKGEKKQSLLLVKYKVPWINM